MSIRISTEHAQRLMLQQQGLLQATPRWGKGTTGALKAVAALGYVQLDAIAVIERAHHHTLWSRVPGYQPAQLYDLLEQQQVFEYWCHAVSFMPMNSYRFYLHRMQRIRQQSSHWFRVEPKIKRMVLDRLRAEGPLYARDFDSHGHVSQGMWDGKPAKKALHELFMSGQVMIRARHKFQRQYDLPERVLPDHLEVSQPDTEALGRFAINTAVHAQGFVRRQEIVYQQTDLNDAVKKMLPVMLENAELVTCHIEGQPKLDYVTTPALLEASLRCGSPRLHLLSPFDNAVIQRKRLQTLFGFGYQTEIYLPAAKRVHGYFAAPILYGTRFIGRYDPKAERDTGRLLIRNLALETDVEMNDAVVQALAVRLHEFARFNKCEQIVFEQVRQKSLGLRLKAALKQIRA